MKTVLLIGIGPGDPDCLTLGAVKAMRRVDVFFFLEKEGAGKAELIRFRHDLLERHVSGRPYRIVRGVTPPRDRGAADYEGAVEDWRDRRTEEIGRLIDGEMSDGETGGFLIWGDPGLYDGTLQSLHGLATRRRDGLVFEVIPGITSVQALAARHKVPLNRIGESLSVTTGRQVSAADPESVVNSVVMLDSRHAYRQLIGQDLDIFWGGDLGTPDEVLIAGPLDQVADHIADTIEAKRAAKGWVMDAYLLRRRGPA